MTPQITDEACVQCGEVITNPICIECLEREMEHWLMEYRPKLISFIRDTTKCFRSYTHDVMSCVICGKNMNICAHCYVKEISCLIKSNRLMKEFLTQFNYDLDYSII